MSTSINKLLPKSTAELNITIPWNEVEESYKKLMDAVVKQTEVSGFRKGKAPKKLVEKNIDKKKLYEEVIRDLIPKAFSDSVKQHNLTPVASPKIQIMEAKENKDWVIKALVPLKPKINLKNYKEKIKELKASKVKIWTPGQKQEETAEQKKPNLDELLNTVADNIEIEISDILIEEETNRLLVGLLDQVQKLGLTIDQYLATKGKTNQSLREEYQKQAIKNLTIEFALAEIADQEKISVSQKDIDDLMAKVKNPQEKENMLKDSYYLAHLLRQQKTLDFLSNL